MGGPRTVAERGGSSFQSSVVHTPGPGREPRLRAGVICLHTTPTAALGRSANGGLNVYVREVCMALGRCGVATDVFTRRTRADGPETEPLGPLSRPPGGEHRGRGPRPPPGLWSASGPGLRTDARL